jgi:hypothetical protein
MRCQGYSGLRWTIWGHSDVSERVMFANAKKLMQYIALAGRDGVAAVNV